MIPSMYYRINHKKKFLFYDKVSLANIKSGFFYELSSKNDPLIDNNIIHLFNFLLKDYLLKSTEKLYLIYTLIEEFKRMKNIQLENYDKISINISRKIIKKNYKMNFDFLSEDLDDICTLISLGFTKIFSTKKIKFKSYEELLKKLEEYNTFFFDVVKIYKTYKFSVPPNAPEIPKGDVPNEILLLKYIFQGIKQLNLNLKNMAKNNILPFLIIILNFDWLFPFVFDVDIDLRYEQLQNDIDNYYFTKEKIFYANYLKNKQTSDDYLYDFDEDNEEKEMEKEIKFNGTEKEIQIIDLIKNDFNKVSNYTNEKKLLNNISEMNSNLNLENIIDGNYINLLIKNENVFDVILCFFYSIKKIKYLKSLNITMPNGFIKENIDLIKIRSIPHNALVDISNINLFEYITPISSVNSFSISFNFLEKKTFENVLFIIQNNSDLREIKLNFFDSYNLNSYNLMKIYQECGVFTSNDIFRNETKIIMNKRIEKIIKQKLLQYLELNLEKLFLLIQTKKSLERLEIIIKLPSKLLESGNENDGYHIAIMKFIINLIILLNSEKLYLKEFKLILPFFNFDNRAYPIIGEVFDKMNLLTKNPQLKSLILEASIYKIYNLKNIISYNLQNLILGEMDLESFQNLIQFYQSDDFIQNSQLRVLNISLNKTVTKYKECKNIIYSFFSGKNPKNMTEIFFKCYFRIKRKNLYDLIKSGNYNQIQEYNIKMKIDKLKKYKNIIEHKEFFFMNKEIERKVNSYLPLFKKYDFLQEKNIKIAQNIFKFLLPSNKKIINLIEI